MKRSPKNFSTYTVEHLNRGTYFGVRLREERRSEGRRENKEVTGRHVIQG